MAIMKAPIGPQAANNFIDFVNASPTPFHAVYNASVKLDNAGFTKVWPSFNKPFILLI